MQYLRFPGRRRATPLLLLLLAATLLSAGCASREVRHLASDACLLTPGQSSRQELLGLLGFPDKKVTGADGSETWYYAQVNRSTMRRTPYVGKWLGSEDYDVLVVTLRGDQVTACVYRNFDANEFKKLEIDTGDDAE